MTDLNPLGMTVLLDADQDAAVARVTAALRAEGFGVLTEIDVQATFKDKLGAEFRPYKILGACNPMLAYKALSAAPEVGLLLPCNVTVSAVGEGRTEIALVDPLVMLGVATQPALAEVAQEARARLERVAAVLRAG